MCTVTKKSLGYKQRSAVVCLQRGIRGRSRCAGFWLDSGLFPVVLVWHLVHIWCMSSAWVFGIAGFLGR